MIGTALLLMLILAITDEFNMPPGANLAPLMIGLVVVAIGMSFGGMHGYAINPARDFGPRLFTVLAGFHNNGITDGARVWWVPVVAPLIGGVLGAGVYDFGIRRFLKRRFWCSTSRSTGFETRNKKPETGSQNPGANVYPNETPNRAALPELNSSLLRII